MLKQILMEPPNVTGFFWVRHPPNEKCLKYEGTVMRYDLIKKVGEILKLEDTKKIEVTTFQKIEVVVIPEEGKEIFAACFIRKDLPQEELDLIKNAIEEKYCVSLQEIA